MITRNKELKPVNFKTCPNPLDILLIKCGLCYKSITPFREINQLSTALLYNGVSTYVGLYRIGLFNFGSYVNHPPLFAYFLGFDVHPFPSFLLKMFFSLKYYNSI